MKRSLLPLLLLWTGVASAAPLSARVGQECPGCGIARNGLITCQLPHG